MTEYVDYEDYEDEARAVGRRSRRRRQQNHQRGKDPDAAWVPARGATTHAGTQIPPEMLFFAAPPPALGPVITAWSTLNQGKTPWSIGLRLLVAAAVGFILPVGCIVLAMAAQDQVAPGVWLVLLTVGLGITAIAFFLTAFRHTCSYVGEKGIARFKIRGDVESQPAEEILLFRNAASLTAGQTRNYVNGAYTGTTYDFRWLGGHGETLLRLKGQYKSKTGNPKPKDPFHFAQSAENAWNVAILDRLQAELNQHGSVEFGVNQRDAVRVGPGFIEFDFKGQVDRVPAHAIKTLNINDGVFVIHTKEARWFGSRGKFSFNYNQLTNASLFIFALENLLGYQFQ